MSLVEIINEDLKTAMKNKEKDKLEALRAIKTAFLLAKTAEGASGEITEEDEIKIIQKLVKQRKDSAEQYETQNRKDLADKELFEAKIISEYLPQQLTTEELTTAIKKIIASTGAQSVKDMGKVMGIASKQLTGKADGKDIASKVKELLA